MHVNSLDGPSRLVLVHDYVLRKRRGFGGRSEEMSRGFWKERHRGMREFEDFSSQ